LRAVAHEWSTHGSSCTSPGVVVVPAGRQLRMTFDVATLGRGALEMLYASDAGVDARE